MKKALTIKEQIERLKNRGMIVDDEKRAERVLLDIGYYRLGFYWFHFETDRLAEERQHIFKKKSHFDHAYELYKFDAALRAFLEPYLHAIEVNIRTYVVYTMSVKNVDKTTWFADPQIMKQKFIDDFGVRIYPLIKKNYAIQKHHQRYINDRYAPVWKTLEYIMLGDLLLLIKNIKDSTSKESIWKHYGFNNFVDFNSATQALRYVRNNCAHGHNTFDLKLSKPIRGMHGLIKRDETYNIHGIVKLIAYFLSYTQESVDDFNKGIEKLYNEIPQKIRKYIK